MNFLPNFEEIADIEGWSQAQRISLITLVYVDVALYLVLLVLALRNMWVVVPHHYKQLKMLPSPAFYAFSLHSNM